MATLQLSALRAFDSQTPLGTLIPCVVRISTPASQNRVPIHLNLLIDVSESMAEEHRLDNVKECCKLLLNFLNEKDYLTLITFGDTAKTVISAVPVNSGNREHLVQVLNGLRVDGCTNLSAGIASLRTSLDSLSTEVKACKQGLLILTDGHANRGLSSETGIKQLFQSLHDSQPGLAIHSVGYGSTHNADLLRSIAEEVNGSYNVVNQIEDTAFAFGDTVGGLMSCYFQNAQLKMAPGSVIKGPHVCNNNSVTLGDIYSGVKQLYLLDIPVEALRIHAETPCVVLEAMRVPSLESVSMSSPVNILTEKDVEAELTRLRYECSDILKALGSSRDVDSLRTRVVAFELAMADESLVSNPLHGLLKAEISVMRSLLDEISQRGRISLEATTSAQQHSAFVGLARGFSTPMASGRVRRVRTRSVESQEENPTSPLQATTSVFQNSVQATMSALMSQASQGVGSAHNE